MLCAPSLPRRGRPRALPGPAAPRRPPAGAALALLALAATLSCAPGAGRRQEPSDETGGGAPDARVAQSIAAVQIEANPRSVLSCTVRWRTARPATSAVEFGEGPLPSSRVSDPTPTTEHEVLVIGLHAARRYLLRAISVTSDGTVHTSALQEHRTGRLPAHIPRGVVSVHRPGRAYAGWTLMTVSAAKRSVDGVVKLMDEDFPPTTVMYDMQGRPVWYRVHGVVIPGDVQLRRGRVLVHGPYSLLRAADDVAGLEYDLAGRLRWRGPPQAQEATTGRYHHSFRRLPWGNYLGLVRYVQDGVIGDEVVELTRDHEIVWRWNIFDHLQPNLALWPATDQWDWSHCNSVALDAAGDAVYLNSRNTSKVYKIRRSTGALLWTLGRGGDFQAAADPTPWFDQAHGLHLLPDGHLLLYDNGIRTRGFSRAVEYAVDPATRQARIAWQFAGQGEHAFATTYWGDADRLPNGNTLICAGTWEKGQSSVLLEVTPQKEVVWKMAFPPRPSTGSSVGVYNAERVLPPTLERL